MKKILIAVAVVALVFAAGTVQAKDWKMVRIGVEGAYPPFSWTSADGKLEGFDIDIAVALCKAMGVEYKLWPRIGTALFRPCWPESTTASSLPCPLPKSARKKSLSPTNIIIHRLN